MEGKGRKSKEQLEAEKRAILKQRIKPLEIDGFDAPKLTEKAKELHSLIYRLEGEKYDLEKRFKSQQIDVRNSVSCWIVNNIVKSRQLCYFLESRSICLKCYLLESRISLKIFYFLESRKYEIKSKSNGLFCMAAICWIDTRIKYNNKIKCNNTRLYQIIYEIIKLNYISRNLVITVRSALREHL